ncbi:MAG: hypothetical protein LQ349_004577 [Xanthoria aureola]|nr:MAG: hypothetical protein LQ349_004577 [Xanthoria aureola]
MGEEIANLTMLAEKMSPLLINSSHLSYCPAMDLLALAAQDERVHVFRLNGQRVFGVSTKEAVGRVTYLQWNPNGQALAVAFGDSVCVASANSGKIMYQKDYPTPSKAPICCLGWASNFTDVMAIRKRVANLQGTAVLDDLMSSVDEPLNPQHALDLPIELAFVDVASTLPKLATLPVAGSQADVFSSRVSLDALFKSSPIGSSDRADVLIIGHEDGTIHLSMSEDFSIGKFRLQDAELSLSNSKPFLHCSHLLSTTHALLCSKMSTGVQEIQLVPFDLRLVSIAGRQLSLLASKITELHSLHRYLRQIQDQLSIEIRTSQDLPSRFMRNINETLLEKSDCTWVDAAYHLAATGHCYPEVKEWLVDGLGERGHKRWDKAVNVGYENVRRLTHESLLPALDRLRVLLSRLRGLSRFHSSDFSLGLSRLEIDNMLDSVNCFQLLAHQLLKCAVAELQQFAAFSTWLRHEIEKQAVDPMSASAQEIAGSDMSFDHSGILDYIQGAMQHTQMRAYTLNEMGGGRPWDLEDEGGPIFELYKTHLNNQSSGFRSQRQLPGFVGLIEHFEKQSRVFFEHVSETQRRNVQIGVPISLGVGNPTCADMRMVDEHDKTTTAIANFSIYVALGPSPGQDCVNLFRVTFFVENGVSSTTSVASSRIPVATGAVRDLKFIDDRSLMLAFVSADDVSRLLQIDFRPNKDSETGLRYQEIGLAGKAASGELNEREVSGSHEIDLRRLSDISTRTVHRFPPGRMWTPLRLEINGRKGRRTICVLAEDRIHYRQFTIDSLNTGQGPTP